MSFSADFGALREAGDATRPPQQPRAWDAEWAGLGEEVIVAEAFARLQHRFGITQIPDRSDVEHFALACLALLSRLDDNRRLAADMQTVAAIEQRARAAVAELERMRKVDDRRREALTHVVVCLEHVGELLAP